MAVPSREVGARYCTPVLTNPEVFLPGGVYEVSCPDIADPVIHGQASAVLGGLGYRRARAEGEGPFMATCLLKNCFR